MAFTRRGRHDGSEAPTPGNFDPRIRGGIVLRPFTLALKSSTPRQTGDWIGGVVTTACHGRGRGPAGRTILSRFDCESCTDCRRRRGRHTGLLQEEAQEEEEEEVRHEVTGLQCFGSGRGDH